MLYQNVIEPYIRWTEKNPDQTVARIGGHVFSYAQLSQRIAPIMNELDALSVSRVGIVVKRDLIACSALLASLFSGIAAVPLPENLSEGLKRQVCEELQLPVVLTVERMHYYYRMTFEDALNRIDNGLYQIEDDQLVFIRCRFNENEPPTYENIYAKDFSKSKPFSLAPVFQKIIPDFPDICSIF